MAMQKEQQMLLSRPTGELFMGWERREGPACVPVLGSDPPLEGLSPWAEVQTPHSGNSLKSCPSSLCPAVTV